MCVHDSCTRKHLIATVSFKVERNTFMWFFFRKCPHCPRILLTERGLKSHITRTESCRIKEEKAKRKENTEAYKKRNEKISNTKFKDLGSLDNMAESSKRPKGKNLKLEEKKAMLRIYDSNKNDLKHLKNPQSAVSFSPKISNKSNMRVDGGIQDSSKNRTL